MKLNPALLTAGGAVAKTYVDDVFSAYTYVGNGSTQTITNGIDLAGKGGMVWIKSRNVVASHRLFDTSRGVGNSLVTDSTAGTAYAAEYLSAFNSNGFSLSTANDVNEGGYPLVSWTFRKAPKFFDIVTYTGNGANRTIAHSLGQVPGMIAVKRTDTAGAWMVYHNSISNTENLVLNTTAAKATGTTVWNSTTATASAFSIGTHADVNTNTGTYVAYLFAHDASADGLIQCGSFTETGSTVPVNLGWEPQYLLVKRSNGVGNWWVFDTMRGWVNTSGANSQYLCPNLSQEEIGVSNWLSPTATGFNAQAYDGAGATWVYLAIRRPNKPPTTGTQVFNALTPAPTGVNSRKITGAGFAPDSLWLTHRTGGGFGTTIVDRLRGMPPQLNTYATTAESTTQYSAGKSPASFDMDGFTEGSADSVQWDYNLGYTNVFHMFRRAPGVFDVVCYTGNDTARTLSHGLMAIPELMIVKSRGTGAWLVYSAVTGATQYTILNSTQAASTNPFWNDTAPTSSVFSVGTDSYVNAGSTTYVAYLFATLAGVSYVGGYTGNGGTAGSTGTSQNLNFGFSSGARFLLIKATNATSNWWVWDSTRGIVASTDPHLSLNTTAAEVTTDDSVDSYSQGVTVNQLAATDLNVTGRTYLVLAFA